MKTKTLLLCVSCGLLLTCECIRSLPASAQGPTPAPTLTVQQILDMAKQTADDAQNSSQTALANVTNADSAVNTSNNALRIALGAYIVGAVLVLLIIRLTLKTQLQFFNQSRTDLAQARRRISEIQDTLKTNTDLMHRQAENAVHAFVATQLGEQQLARGNIRGAIQLYEKALTLDPNNRATNYFLGELYIEDRQFEAGIRHLQQIISADMEYAPAEAALGLALYLQGDQVLDRSDRALLYVQAEERLLQALHVDPTALDLYGESIQAALGGLYKRQGRVEQAIARYEEALKITPHAEEPILNLAILYLIQGNLGKALPYFERIENSTATTLSLNPLDEAARIAHLKASIVLGKIQEATTDLSFITQQFKTANTLLPLLDDLNRFKHSPQPPTSIDRLIEQLQIALTNP